MRKLFLGAVIILTTASAAFAEEDSPTPSPWRSETAYGSQVGSKFCFGAKNLLLGWTELIQEPIEQQNPVGVVQGLGNAVMDTIGGLLHVVTAPFTAVDVPLPENGVSVWKTKRGVADTGM